MSGGKSSGRFWAFVPAGLLCGLLGTQVVFLAGALDDPSFAVEEDYYKKAVNWDAKMAQDENNARLGWHVDIETGPLGMDAPIRLELKDKQGRPISHAVVSVEAFSNARAGNISTVDLEEGAGGTYEGRLPLRRLGLWEFRVRAVVRADVFTAVIRRDVGGTAP